jgi:hypothetical protein
MSLFSESEARRDARQDFERGRCDRERYERHSFSIFDRTKEVYTEAWDAAKRDEERLERAREEQREQERLEEAARLRRQREAEMERRQEEEFLYQQQQQEAQEQLTP